MVSAICSQECRTFAALKILLRGLTKRYEQGKPTDTGESLTLPNNTQNEAIGDVGHIASPAHGLIIHK